MILIAILSLHHCRSLIFLCPSIWENLYALAEKHTGQCFVLAGSSPCLHCNILQFPGRLRPFAGDSAHATFQIRKSSAHICSPGFSFQFPLGRTESETTLRKSSVAS